MTKKNGLSPRSIAAQAGRRPDEENGAVVPPVHVSATFQRDANYELPAGFLYGRCGNPTVAAAEEAIARLEGAPAARLFGTGMAAIAALFETVPCGGHVVLPQVMYFANHPLIAGLAESRGFEISVIDPTDPDAVKASVIPGKTDILWIETPANPTWDIVDITQAAEIAHSAGAILGVDGTAAPPCTTRALDFGADIVFHSATKYLNGHSDLTGGVLAFREGNDRFEAVETLRTRFGSIMAPFEAWLLMRGMRTLFVRYEKASENALAFAQTFEGHRRVEEVLYPGLPSHKGHQIAVKQMTGGFGGMLSLILKGSGEEARKVASSVQLMIPATSLGGVESLIEHRKTIEGDDSPIPDNLLRISIGIEHVDDLIADMRGALAQIG